MNSRNLAPEDMQRIVAVLLEKLEFYRLRASLNLSVLHGRDFGNSSEVLFLTITIEDNIYGAALQIAERGYIKEKERVLPLLKSAIFFQEPLCVAWYLDHQKIFPELCEYIERLDHLQRLVIAYASNE